MATNKEFDYSTTGKEVVEAFADNVKGRTCEYSHAVIVVLDVYNTD
jgi:hypothetical protein